MNKSKKRTYRPGVRQYSFSSWLQLVWRHQNVSKSFYFILEKNQTKRSRFIVTSEENYKNKKFSLTKYLKCFLKTDIEKIGAESPKILTKVATTLISFEFKICGFTEANVEAGSSIPYRSFWLLASASQSAVTKKENSEEKKIRSRFVGRLTHILLIVLSESKEDTASRSKEKISQGKT